MHTKTDLQNRRGKVWSAAMVKSLTLADLNMSHKTKKDNLTFIHNNAYTMQQPSLKNESYVKMPKTAVTHMTT